MINVFIDEYTPCLKDANTGELVQTEVIRIKRKSFLKKYNKRNPQNNKLLTDEVKYYGVGGHLFAIAAKKSVDYGFDGYMTGFAANEDLLRHYVEKLNAEVIAMLHPYQFAVDEANARKIMEVYDYVWTDEEI